MVDISREEIAENLVNARVSLGLSQLKFAKELGINRTTLYLYETGKRAIPTDLLCLIYKKYGIEPNNILGINC